MSLQIQIQNQIKKFNFLMSTMYDRYDLRSILKPNEKFIVRQGDLIITNKLIPKPELRGLRYLYLINLEFRGSHIILPYQNCTAIFHNEHGLVIIPEKIERLKFYTFENSID